MNSKPASVPDWKALGEREYARLAGRYSLATLRNILRAVKGNLIHERLPPNARNEVSRLTYELRKNFTTGPALFILRAADSAAGHAERSARHTQPDQRKDAKTADPAKPNPLRE